MTTTVRFRSARAWSEGNGAGSRHRRAGRRRAMRSRHRRRPRRGDGRREKWLARGNEVSSRPPWKRRSSGELVRNVTVIDDDSRADSLGCSRWKPCCISYGAQSRKSHHIPEDFACSCESHECARARIPRRWPQGDARQPATRTRTMTMVIRSAPVALATASRPARAARSASRAQQGARLAASSATQRTPSTRAAALGRAETRALDAEAHDLDVAATPPPPSPRSPSRMPPPPTPPRPSIARSPPRRSSPPSPLPSSPAPSPSSPPTRRRARPRRHRPALASGRR